MGPPARAHRPALSHAIRQLEKGKFFLDEALYTLNRIDAGTQGVRLFNGGQSGLVRIGFTAAAAFGHLRSMVQPIRKKLPGLEIRSDLSGQEQCDKLREEQFHVGVAHPPLHHTDVELLLSGHPLAEKASLDVNDLRDASFVTEVKPDPGGRPAFALPTGATTTREASSTACWRPACRHRVSAT